MDANSFMAMLDPGQQTANGTPAPVAPPNFGATMNPQPAGFDASQINKPATSPQEFEQRKAGWQALADKFTSDPNLMRSLAFFGAAMAQPIQPGQSALGHMAQAGVTGISAYDLGNYAKQEEELKQDENTRRNELAAANVAESQAQTEATQQHTEQATQMQSDVVSRARSEAEKAATAAAAAKSDEEVNQLERNIKKRRAELMSGVTDATIKASIDAEFQKPIAALQEAKAKATEAQARAKKEGAQASVAEMTREVFDSLKPEEKKAFVTKTGEFSQHSNVSSFAQQRDTWNDFYDKLPADSPLKKGKTKEEFVIERLSAAKASDAAKQLSDYIKAMDTAGETPDPEIVNALSGVIKQNAVSRVGGSAPAANAKPVAVKDAAEYAKLPKGAHYIDPRGVERVKQ